MKRNKSALCRLHLRNSLAIWATVTWLATSYTWTMSGDRLHQRVFFGVCGFLCAARSNAFHRSSGSSNTSTRSAKIRREGDPLNYRPSPRSKYPTVNLFHSLPFLISLTVYQQPPTLRICFCVHLNTLL